MRKIITLITTAIALVISNQINAQEDIKPILERLLQSDYIFEGKVVKTYPYKSQDEKFCYTSNVIQITRIAKGDLACGTVELVTNGCDFENEKFIVSHSLILQEGNMGVFLCKGNSKELSAIDFFPESNYQKLEGHFEAQSFIKYFYEGANIKAADANLVIDSLALLYNLTEFVTQVNIIDCNNSATLLGTTTNTHQQSEPSDNFQFPVYDQNEANAIMQSMIKRAGTTKHNSARAGVEYEYQFANKIITGTTTKYLEFDIFLNSNSSVYFNSGLARVEYNTSTFGSNIAAANKIQVTRGDLIQDVTAYQDPIPLDASSNVVSIPLTSITYTNNLVPISTTPQKGVHVKMEIQNCNNTNINFTDTFFMSFLSAFSTSSSDTPRYFIDGLVATSNFQVPSCKTTITSFTPNPINGGAGELLQIRGYLFGGSGDAFFANSDDGGATKIKLDADDIIGWSDTLITAKITGINKTLDSAGVIITRPSGSIGSGNFIVSSATNQKDTSDQPLTVYYSLTNVQNSLGAKQNIFLVNTDTIGGYKFYVDTALWNNPDARGCVFKAVNDWKCLTGVNWTVAGSIIKPSSVAQIDGVNIIQLGNPGNSVNGQVLAQSFPRFIACSNAPSARWTLDQVDIVFGDTYVWQYDSSGTQAIDNNKRDFYATLLHELGHAHILNHVNNSSAIMHWLAQSPGPLPAANRKVKLFQDGSAGFGGNKEMDISEGVSFGGCTNPVSQIIRINLCEPFTSIANTQNTKVNVSTYPNPFSSDIVIELDNDHEKHLELKMIDVTGKLLFEKQSNSLEFGKLTFKISTENLPKGIYTIYGKLGNSFFSSIVIKNTN